MRHIFRGMVVFGWAVLSPLAWAHDPGLSSAEIRLSPDHIEVLTTFADADARGLVTDENGGEALKPDSEAFHSLLAKAALTLWRLRVAGTIVAPVSTVVTSAAGNNIAVAQDFSGEGVGAIDFTTTIFGLLPPGHRQHVTILASDGQLLAEKLLSVADPVVQTLVAKSANRAPVANPREVRSDPTDSAKSIRPGVETLLTGSDRLSFLFASLAVIAIGGSYWFLRRWKRA